MATSGPKRKRKGSIEFLIPADQRQAFISHIISQISEDTIQNTGTVFKLNTEGSDTIYHIIVSKNITTGDIQYHAYDPNFEKLKLGKGAQGEVVIAQNLVTGGLVAVKCQQTNGFYDEIVSERENLLQAKELIGTAVDEAGVEYTIMEYNRGYNLLDKLYTKDKTKDRESEEYFSLKNDLSLIEKAELINLAIEAIIWLHDEIGLVHRDIKPDNLVLIERMTRKILKFVDFGSAIDPKKITNKNIALYKLFVGTFGYAPPELIVEQSKRKPYSFASDIFVLGIVIAEILTCHNYQKALRIHRLKQSDKDTCQELSLDEIKKMMPDAFKHEIIPVTQNEEKLLDELLALISLCTNEDVDARPNLEFLKKVQPPLARKIDQLKLIQQGSAKDRIAKYHELKRQHSVLLLSDAKSPSPSQDKKKDDTSQTTNEKKEKPAKKMSTADKRNLLKRAATSSKIKSDKIKKAKSVPEKPIDIKDKKSKPSEKPTDEVLRKRSMSAAASEVKKSKSKLKSSAASSAPLPSLMEVPAPDLNSEDDLLGKLKLLSLDRVKPKSSAIISPDRSMVEAFQHMSLEVKVPTEGQQSSIPSIESDPEVIDASLDMLSQRLSTMVDSHSQQGTSDVAASALSAKDTLLLGVFRQKLEHVRQTSGDKKAFRQSLTELDSLSDLVQTGSAIGDKADAVKKTCVKLLKHKE